MKNPTPRDLRNAVVLAVIVTAIVTTALLDPSCRASGRGRSTPSHSIAP